MVEIFKNNFLNLKLNQGFPIYMMFTNMIVFGGNNYNLEAHNVLDQEVQLVYLSIIPNGIIWL